MNALFVFIYNNMSMFAIFFTKIEREQLKTATPLPRYTLPHRGDMVDTRGFCPAQVRKGATKNWADVYP